MKDKVLIITYSDDNECVLNTSNALKAMGAEVFTFYSDKFPKNIHISGRFDKKNYRQLIQYENLEIPMQEITAIWYRRLRLGGDLQGNVPAQYIKPVIEESNVSLWGILNGTNAFQLDAYIKHRIAANKFKQLELAENLGMQIPETLVTNNIKELQKFYKELDGNIIMKMHHSFAIYDKEGKESVVFTNKFPEEYLNDEAGLRLCPLTFQRNIEKKRELRVTVVGNHIFSAAVDSQKTKSAQYDWRKEGEALLFDWYEYDIPKDLKIKILQLMDLYQLNYGAFDFIEDLNGNLVFLEVNSGGEFMWLDLLFKGKITEALALVLANKSERRTSNFPKF